jgi:hypothetical protein
VAMHRWRARTAALAALALALAGCASASEDEVAAVAGAFADAARDAAERCGLLAPATLAVLESQESASCESVLPDLPLPGGAVESVEVWGGNAQVRLAGDTLFLAETRSGWKVVAAGCQPRGDAPYDCEVDGP